MQYGFSHRLVEDLHTASNQPAKVGTSHHLDYVDDGVLESLKWGSLFAIDCNPYGAIEMSGS